MADVVSREKRSEMMSGIRAANTQPELLIRKTLSSLGFRYRLNVKKLPGKPDLVLKKYNAVIFVNGCFWHGHRHCRRFRLPASNVNFWTEKIKRNRTNDRKCRKILSKAGWRIADIWECALRGKNKLEIPMIAATLCEWLQNGVKPFLTISGGNGR